MRELTEATAFQQLRNHPGYIKNRDKLILRAWRDENKTWGEVAERVGISLRSAQRAAQRANGGVYPKPVALYE